MRKMTLTFGFLLLAFAATVQAQTTLVDEDFQTPLKTNGSTLVNGDFGWNFGSSIKSARSDNRSDFTGSTTIPNQGVQFEWGGSYMTYDTGHTWANDDYYTLSLNATEQSWGSASDRIVAVQIRETGTSSVLWSGQSYLPEYDVNHNAGDDWSAAQSFSWLFDAGDFSGSAVPITLAVGSIDDSTSNRGLFADNILLQVDNTPPVDNDPPSPDPSEWSLAPVGFDYTSTFMRANVATDPSDVEYMFENQTTAATSGWQDGTTWQQNELNPDTTYDYKVKARDKSTNQNETGWSPLGSITTPTVPEGLIFSSGFQYPDHPNGTGNPDFYGWSYQNAGSVKSRTTQNQSDFPGVWDTSTGTYNRGIQFEYTNATATRETSHEWAADDIYTLSFNAAPLSWGSPNTRYIIPSLLLDDGTELWSEEILLPAYDGFGRKEWTDDLTFSFEILASEFAAGTPPGLISVKMAHSGQRGVYIDNVMLTFRSAIPEPATLAFLGLGMLGLFFRRR